MPATASAHVQVTPKEVLTGSLEVFTLAVPTERSVPTTAVTLRVPGTVQHVTPNTAPGWNVQIKRTGDNSSDSVSAITWNGGTVPAGLRQEFLFQAKMPDSAQDITWQVIQTYKDGKRVLWELSSQDATSAQEPSDATTDQSGPAAITKVVAKTSAARESSAEQTARQALIAGVAGIVVALAAFAVASRPR